MTWDRIIAIASATGAALAGIVTLVGEIDPKWGLAVAIAANFITLFCNRVQGEKKEGV